MICEEYGDTALLGRANQQDRNGAGKRVHMHYIRSFRIQYTRKDLTRLGIAPAVELVQHVLAFRGRAKPVDSQSVVFIKIANTFACRSRDDGLNVVILQFVGECLHIDFGAADGVGRKREGNVQDL